MKFNNDKFILNRDFIYKNNRLHLTPEGKKKIKKPKKLTGSRLGAVFSKDDFKTPFQLWCDILGMYVDESDRFFLDAGIAIEVKLKKHAEKKIGKRFRSYDVKAIRYDLFPDNKVFGGIPDGEEVDENGNILSILEIKTAQLDKYNGIFRNNQFILDLSKNNKPSVKIPGGGLVKGFKNGEVVIPTNYEYQLALYLYLRGITKGYFCVAFMKKEDYENPNNVNFVSEFNNYKGYDVLDNAVLDRNEHLLIGKEYTIDLDKFKESIDYAKDGYEKHVIEGVSPPMTENDLTGFRYGYPELG